MLLFAIDKIHMSLIMQERKHAHHLLQVLGQFNVAVVHGPCSNLYLQWSQPTCVLNQQ
jgi:hypothetical protein